MRTWFLLLCALATWGAFAQPGLGLPRAFSSGCVFPPPDSVDVTGDGIADLVVRGMHGISTCDIPVSVGMCEVVVLALPGTLLLGCLTPIGGRDVCGFDVGDTLHALDEGIRDDLRIPRYAFIDGAVRALSWSYGRNGASPPQMAHMAKRVFVFASTHGERTVYGTFTLEHASGELTVSIRPRALFAGNRPYIVE
jgi:hypothetical protein